MRGRERHAIAAAAHFERLSEDSESESAEVKEALLNWAKAEIILRNSEEARGILKEGLDGVGQEGNAGEWRTLLLQTWMGPIRQKLAEREVENAMELLDSAADEVGSSRELIEAAASLASQASEPLRVELNEFYERMRDVAEKNLAMEVALGSMALALERTEDGLAHIERAIELDPDHVVALNNLGYGCVLLADPPQLDRGIELLDRAVAAGRKAGKIPPNVMGTGLLMLFVFAELTSSRERSHRYLLAARRAMVTDKLETAEIFYKKALLESPDDLEALLEAAAVADRLDEQTRRGVLKRLVDEDAYPGGDASPGRGGACGRGRGTRID